MRSSTHVSSETRMQANSETLCGEPSLVPSLGCARKPRIMLEDESPEQLEKVSKCGVWCCLLQACPTSPFTPHSFIPRWLRIWVSAHWLQGLTVEVRARSQRALSAPGLQQIHSPPSSGGMKKPGAVQNIKLHYFWSTVSLQALTYTWPLVIKKANKSKAPKFWLEYCTAPSAAWCLLRRGVCISPPLQLGELCGLTLSVDLERKSRRGITSLPCYLLGPLLSFSQDGNHYTS